MSQTRRDKILAVLKHGPSSIAQIAAALESTPKTIAPAVAAMVAAGDAHIVTPRAGVNAAVYGYGFTRGVGPQRPGTPFRHWLDVALFGPSAQGEQSRAND